MEDKITEYFRKNWVVVAGLAVALLFLVFFKQMFFIGIFLALTVVASIFASKTKIKLLGVELVTFSTVTIGYAYGPLWGAIAGIGLEGINAFVVSRWIRAYNMWVLPSFALAGIVAGLNFGVPFATLGIVIAVGLHVIYALISLVVTGHLHPKYILYAVPNIIFNIFLFTGFGAKALGFLS